MKRLAIFAGYDKDSIIDDYVIYYLKELKKVADIIFVYDTKFSKKELEKVKNLTIHQICEPHGEYDFGSYKRGYLWAKEQDLLTQYDSLILCNDSAFGPFGPFAPIFEEMESKQNIDAWSIFYEKNKPIEYAYMQTYFVVLNKNVFNSDIFDQFIKNVVKNHSKSDVIRKYELGLTQLLLNNNFSCDGVYIDNNNAPHNEKAIPLLKNNFPFLKRSLFDVNSQAMGCSVLYKYKEIISEKSKYPIEYIENNINRLFKKEDLEFMLSHKFKTIDLNIIHRKIFKIRGKYLPDHRYKILICLFGIRIIKFFISEKNSTKKVNK